MTDSASGGLPKQVRWPGRIRRSPLVFLVPVMLATAWLAMSLGSVHIPATEVIRRCAQAATGQASWDAADRILFETRLPRIILATGTGVVLALVGLAAQTLFLNPLASPYVVGISSGSALGAVIGMLLLGATTWSFEAVPLASAAFGVGVTGLLFSLASSGKHTSQTLLLAGIAIGSLCAALTAGALYLAEERLQTLVFWMMGGFWRAGWRDVGLLMPVAMLAWLAMWLMSPTMDVLLLGRRSANDLGVNVPRTLRFLLLLIGFATAVAVSLTGIIGFVDLIVPHLLRRILGAGHRRLVPACALTGGTLMILADLAARVLARPAEIPVGIVTAVLGSPVFLWLLLRRFAREVGA